MKQKTIMKNKKSYDQLLGIMQGYQQMILVLTAKQQSNGNPNLKSTLFVNDNNTASSFTRVKK